MVGLISKDLIFECLPHEHELVSTPFTSSQTADSSLRASLDRLAVFKVLALVQRALDKGETTIPIGIARNWLLSSREYYETVFWYMRVALRLQ